MREVKQPAGCSGGQWFVSTHWSVVLEAAHADPARRAAALARLCQIYWYPVYAYIRRRGNGPEDAQDLAQEFFARLLEKQWLSTVEKNGSRFRSFLLTAVNGYLANQYDRARAAKRGGGREVLSLDAVDAEHRYLLEPATNETPEKIFDRRWAVTVLDRALARLKEETEAAGKGCHFEQLNPFLSREPEAGEYTAVAAKMGVSSGSVSVSVHRLRQRYRALVRIEIAETVLDSAQVDEEMRELFEALRG